MKVLSKIILSVAVCLSVAPNCHAKTRRLFCENEAGIFQVGPCPLNTVCVANVAIGVLNQPHYTSNNYGVVRTVGANGSYVFKPRSGTNRKCTITLKDKNRFIDKVSCASSLHGSECRFEDR